MMGFNFLDIFASAVVFTLAIVLTFVKMPDGEHWRAIRRMNKLLIICYIVMGISNIVTAILMGNDSPSPIMMVSILVVSMYQAMLFTATCVVFIYPKKISVSWLIINAVVIAIISVGIVTLVCMKGNFVEVGIWTGIIVYAAELAYYCRLFSNSYKNSLRKLEENFDEDMRDSLRLVKNSFIGALAVGICALMFVIFRLGIICYNTFTCIYVVYYVYLVISVINYRIESGYIIKAIASDEKASDKSPDNENIEAELPPLAINPDAETQLSDALDKWVKEKQYVCNDQTVEEIATELGTTHTMLKWYFTNRMHTTFRTWRQNLRLMEAKRLLSDENIPTSAIPKLIGVVDKSNFHKLFRKQEGMTPQEYRNKIKH